MKKGIIVLALSMMLLLILSGCGNTDNAPAAAKPADDASAGVSEIKVIRWARGTSGNGLVTVAKQMGYFEEVGLTVEELPMENSAFTAMIAGQVDVASNFGTNEPLQQIAAGEDFTIFGGHMITGCMPIIAKKGTVWNGVEDLLGKKVTSAPNFFPLTGPLLDKGHNPLKDVEWMILPGHSDRVAAVVSGEADYGVIGTGQMYAIKNIKDIEIIAYVSDVMPNYSCCRMVASTKLIKDDPTTVKLLLKALIRAQAYYESNKEKVVAMMAKELGTSEEYVAAYMLNEDYRIHIDPARKPVLRAWEILGNTGFLDEKAKTINIEQHINTELYKKALDEVIAKHRDENPEFYDKMLAYYMEQNL